MEVDAPILFLPMIERVEHMMSFCVLHRLPRGFLRNRKTERAPQARVHIAEIVTKK